MGKMTIWRVKYLAKVAHTNVTVVLNIPTSVMMTQEDSLSSQIPTLDFVDRRRLDGDNDNLES